MDKAARSLASLPRQRRNNRLEMARLHLLGSVLHVAEDVGGTNDSLPALRGSS